MGFVIGLRVVGASKRFIVDEISTIFKGNGSVHHSMIELQEVAHLLIVWRAQQPQFQLLQHVGVDSAFVRTPFVHRFFPDVIKKRSLELAMTDCCIFYRDANRPVDGDAVHSGREDNGGQILFHDIEFG